MGHAHATLSGSTQPRQIQSADSAWTGARHCVSYLSRSWREESARLSLFCARARGALVRHLSGVSRDHSRARRLCTRTNGQPRAVTLCWLKTFRAGADRFVSVPAAVWIAEVHALCRIDESARMGPAAVRHNHRYRHGRYCAGATCFGDGEDFGDGNQFGTADPDSPDSLFRFGGRTARRIESYRHADAGDVGVRWHQTILNTRHAG